MKLSFLLIVLVLHILLASKTQLKRRTFAATPWHTPPKQRTLKTALKIVLRLNKILCVCSLWGINQRVAPDNGLPVCMGACVCA